jgi:eukaryotic-like serine/threonine-protein kinase
MTPQRWQRIEELYHSALERHAALRSDFLAEACADDPELRHQIESLLAQSGPQSNHGSLLDRPAWENSPSVLEVTVTQFESIEQLGPYRLVAKIGQGGMGVVYRAHDSRLGRDVAIKIVSARFSARLERETRAIAALNHPHICTLYDVGPNYLVMELLEGETLAARLKKGRLSVTETSRLGAQVAGALAEAHAKGVTHRDLKPANVMLTSQGAKVVDFGIAAFAGSGESLTQAGVIMGTPAYMAPEQRRGETADERTDIYALGLILYEMCTGTRPDVRPNEALEGLPEHLAPVIERCLAAEPSNRWQAAADVKAVLDWSGTRPHGAASVPPPKRAWRWMTAVGAGLTFACAIVWTLFEGRPAVPIAALNVSLLPPPATSFLFDHNGEGGFAISPDGATLAFVGRTQGKAQLWVRRLSEAKSRLVPDSEDAFAPFWSPDSRWIGFFTPLKLKKSEVASGATLDLCDAPKIPAAGTWGARGTILFANRTTQPIQQIADKGGSPVPVPGTEFGSDPYFLPDGGRFIYGNRWNRDLWLASLDPNDKPRHIGATGRRPTYSAGYLLSVSDGSLMATPFDVARVRFTGGSVPLHAPLAVKVQYGTVFADFSANARGMLVYPPQTDSLEELRWRDRGGKLLGSLAGPGEYYTPRISPDGRRVAFMRRDGNNSDIWVTQIATNSEARLTFHPGIDDNPVWSPDGAAVTFANDASGAANLYRKAASGAGPVDRLTTSSLRQQALDWSHDGRFLLFTQITAASTEIMVQPEGGQPLSFLGEIRGATHAQFNPGVPRWIAYDFDDSGRREIYVQAFEPGKPASSARWQISNAGGTMPRWRGDGKEIFYLSLGGKLMAARVSGDGPSFQSSTPEPLFEATPPFLRSPSFEYDVAPDGQRFIMIEPAEKAEYLPLTLMTNWLSK